MRTKSEVQRRTTFPCQVLCWDMRLKIQLLKSQFIYLIISYLHVSVFAFFLLLYYLLS